MMALPSAVADALHFSALQSDEPWGHLGKCHSLRAGQGKDRTVRQTVRIVKEKEGIPQPSRTPSNRHVQ